MHELGLDWCSIPCTSDIRTHLESSSVMSEIRNRTNQGGDRRPGDPTRGPASILKSYRTNSVLVTVSRYERHRPTSSNRRSSHRILPQRLTFWTRTQYFDRTGTRVSESYVSTRFPDNGVPSQQFSFDKGISFRALVVVFQSQSKIDDYYVPCDYWSSSPLVCPDFKGDISTMRGSIPKITRCRKGLDEILRLVRRFVLCFSLRQKSTKEIV